MQHKYFYTIEAKDEADLGRQKGELFGDVARETLHKRQAERNWSKKVELAKHYYDFTLAHFPQYIEEIKAYAKASNISLADFWLLSLEIELDYMDSEKCSTIVTNGGKLLSHNEDWERGSEDKICIVKKTIHGLTTLEFFYYNTLGNASVCISSNGYVMTLNDLESTDRQIGIPRNVIARWLSETKDLKSDFNKMQTLKRASGYNHIFITTHGQTWNLESSATQSVLYQPELPYAHTNHFITKELVKYEAPGDPGSTYNRLDSACKLMKSQMSVEEIKKLNSDNSLGEDQSLFNERTIGRFIVDLEKKNAYIWLKREAEKDWIAYPLDFI